MGKSIMVWCSKNILYFGCTNIIFATYVNIQHNNLTWLWKSLKETVNKKTLSDFNTLLYTLP